MARDVFIGVDLGSHHFRMIAAERSNSGEPPITPVAESIIPAAGIRRGSVTSIDEAQRSLAALRENIEKRLGGVVGEAFVGIGGPHLFSQLSHGLVVVSRADNRVGQDDIRRVLEAAGALSMENNHEVLDVLPREFIIDETRGIRDAEGMQGRRLEVHAVVIAVASQHLKHMRQVLSESDLARHSFVATTLAAAKGVLTPRQKELGVALVDIGHGTTDITIFEEGEVLGTASIAIGGAHLTNDIAIGLRCTIEEAEFIKHTYGTANAKEVSSRDTITIPAGEISDEAITFSQKELATIIDARLDEIFELVGKTLKKFERWRLLPAGVVLIGGTSELPGIVERAKHAFHLPVQQGTFTHHPDTDLSYATALGLTMLAAEHTASKKSLSNILRLPSLPFFSRRRSSANTRSITQDTLASRVKRLLKSFLP